MEAEGCRRGGNEEGRVEELTRITKTPKWQRAPGERVTAEERGEKRARHEGGEKVYLLTTSPRESAVFFVLGEKQAAHRRSQRIRRRTEKQRGANVEGALKRRSAFSIVPRQSFLNHLTLVAALSIFHWTSMCNQTLFMAGRKERKKEKEIYHQENFDRHHHEISISKMYHGP